MRRNYRIAVILKSWISHSLQIISGLIAHTSPQANFEFIDLDFTMDVADLPRILQEKAPHGAIACFSPLDLQRMGGACPLPVPLVNIGTSLPNHPFPCVVMDMQPQGRLITAHLRPLHGSSVGCVIDDTNPTSVKQFEDLRQAFSLEGREVFVFREVWAHCKERYTCGDHDRLRAWLAQLPKPADVVCDHGYFGQWVIETAKVMGLDIPAEVRVVSLIDERVCLFSNPAQTAIRVDGYGLGARAMVALDELLHGAEVPTEPLLIEAEALSLVSRGSTLAGGPNADPIQRAVEYIERYACDRISVEDVLVQTPSVARTRFYTLFTERTGVSPAAFIRRARVNKAAELISQTNFSLNHIAEVTGFSSSSQLSTSFNSIMGVTPSDYRRQQRQGGR